MVSPIALVSNWLQANRQWTIVDLSFLSGRIYVDHTNPLGLQSVLCCCRCDRLHSRGSAISSTTLTTFNSWEHLIPKRWYNTVNGHTCYSSWGYPWLPTRLRAQQPAWPLGLSLPHVLVNKLRLPLVKLTAQCIMFQDIMYQERGGITHWLLVTSSPCTILIHRKCEVVKHWSRWESGSTHQWQLSSVEHKSDKLLWEIISAVVFRIPSMCSMSITWGALKTDSCRSTYLVCHTLIVMCKIIYLVLVFRQNSRGSKHNQWLLFSCYSNPLLQRPFIRMVHHFPITIWSQLLDIFHNSVVTISELLKLASLFDQDPCMKYTAYVTYIKNTRESTIMLIIVSIYNGFNINNYYIHCYKNVLAHKF